VDYHSQPALWIALSYMETNEAKKSWRKERSFLATDGKRITRCSDSVTPFYDTDVETVNHARPHLKPTLSSAGSNLPTQLLLYREPLPCRKRRRAVADVDSSSPFVPCSPSASRPQLPKVPLHSLQQLAPAMRAWSQPCA
jgi:hypothetical protein